MPMLKRSLRTSMLAMLMLPTLVTVTLLGALLYVGARQALERALGERLLSIGQALAADLSGGVEASQIERLDETKQRTRARLTERLQAVRQATGVKRLFIMDAEFQALIDTDETTRFRQRLFAFDADRFEVHEALKTLKPASSVLFRGEDGALYKTAYVPLTVREGEGDSARRGRPVAVIGVVASASFFEVLNDLAKRFALLGLIGVGGMGLLGVLFARRLNAPLERLVQAAGRLERGELDEAVLPERELERAGRGDEIERLAHSFERMRQAVLDRDLQMQMMLSGIAHEVRNPLGGMELFCGLLREDLELDEPPDEARLDKIRRIERELVYLNRVVTNFLDFARRGQQVELERFGVAAFFDEITALLGAEAASASCELTFKVEPPELEVTADRERLRRALINAVRNAWQASSAEGGEILLTGRAQGASARVLSVTDHGEGIAKEKLEAILTPFFTTREKGSGLGLAMTQKIIASHGGRLLIESELGVGTTVSFELPFDERLRAHEPERGFEQQGDIPQGWLG